MATRTKPGKTKAAPAVEPDPIDEEFAAEVEAEEPAEVEAVTEADTEERDPVDTVLNRRPRSNERAYHEWLVESGVEGVDLDTVHAVLGLYRVWKDTDSYESFKEALAYSRENKDEAKALRTLERLEDARKKAEADLAAAKAARAAATGATAPAPAAPAKAAKPAKAAPAKAAAAKAALAAAPVESDDDDDNDGDDDDDF